MDVSATKYSGDGAYGAPMFRITSNSGRLANVAVPIGNVWHVHVALTPLRGWAIMVSGGNYQ